MWDLGAHILLNGSDGEYIVSGKQNCNKSVLHQKLFRRNKVIV